MNFISNASLLVSLSVLLAACGGGGGGGASTQAAAVVSTQNATVASAPATAAATGGTTTAGGAAGATNPNNASTTTTATTCSAPVATASVGGVSTVGTSQSWHLQKVQAQKAWTMTGGQGVVVAVLDSGVDPTHPDLQGRLVAGWNFVEDNADTRDAFGHGTRVAGIVAAGSANAQGVAGIASGARVMPIRVSDATGNATVGRVLYGIVYAADHGAKVINISFSDMVGNPLIEEAANYAKSKGAVVVVAAGNDGKERQIAKSSAMIVVGGSDENDARLSWSDFGTHISMVAPGQGIWTTLNGGGYKAVMGTSFSAPIVAGVAALMMAINPSAKPDQIMSWMRATADDLGPVGEDTQTGAGRVNADRAVRLAMNPGTAATIMAETNSSAARPTCGG